ncbi:MAG: 2Fe-2S iron-sulfur cluster-binding protein [Cyanobacteria bacterium P01_F01_bin.3]
MSSCTIEFPNTDYPSVLLDDGSPVSIALNLQNSPILFGCRTGICGTCLVTATGNMLPPTEDEQEVLSILAPNHPSARLACQLKPTGNLALTPLNP